MAQDTDMSEDEDEVGDGCSTDFGAAQGSHMPANLDPDAARNAMHEIPNGKGAHNPSTLGF